MVRPIQINVDDFDLCPEINPSRKPKKKKKFYVYGYIIDDKKIISKGIFSIWVSRLWIKKPDSKEEMCGKERKGRRVLNSFGRRWCF
jgi:hypothetical protein